MDAGFLLGSQLPETVYYPIHFADQDWKAPNRERYMVALAEHRPHMASVLDLEHESQLDEVLGWAEDAARFVQVVMIIPKAFGIIERLPGVSLALMCGSATVCRPHLAGPRCHYGSLTDGRRICWVAVRRLKCD